MNQRRPSTPPAPPASPKRTRLDNEVVQEEVVQVPATSSPELSRPFYPHPVSPHCYPIDPAINRSQCFICHGQGHWARDCTSLPAMYLVADAPRCFTCGGSGHYARFCPNTIMLVMERISRPRVQSLPPMWTPGWFYEDHHNDEGEYEYEIPPPSAPIEPPAETPRYYYDVDSET